MERFGLQGPVSDDGTPADVRAQMLPVLLLIQHDEKGSRALLMERRTGALMGDISFDDYGCVAISPLWLGGTERQNSLYVVHNVPDLDGAAPLADGLWLGGWSAARPKVADSTLAESRFKFYLGDTDWQAGQLQKEFEEGAWLSLNCSSDLIIKDRVMGWRPGKPKPVWTELVGYLGAAASALLEQVYPPGEDK